MARRALHHRVTLARVAQESKVSVTTASLILSGRPENLAQFQTETVERVRRIAEDLGYRANLFASSLLAARASFFALIMQGSNHTSPDAWRDSAYEAELLRGITETSTAEEIYPIVATAGPQAGAARILSIARIMAGGVFGTIVRTPNTLLETCMRSRIDRGHPIVVAFPDQLQDWPENAIDVDNVALGRTAGRLLAAQGARRWLLLQDAAFHAGQALRSQGCQQAAEEAGAEHLNLELPPRHNGGPEVSEFLLDQVRQFRPDGVFGMTLNSTVSTLRTCQQLGMKAGQDFALVGCDCAFWYHSPDPQITSVDVSWFDTGAAAIRQLMDMAETGDSRFQTIVLPPRVIEGDTCRMPAEFKP